MIITALYRWVNYNDLTALHRWPRWRKAVRSFVYLLPYSPYLCFLLSILRPWPRMNTHELDLDLGLETFPGTHPYLSLGFEWRPTTLTLALHDGLEHVVLEPIPAGCSFSQYYVSRHSVFVTGGTRAQSHYTQVSILVIMMMMMMIGLQVNITS